MMSEKRFEWIDKDTISDNQTDEWYCFLFDDIRDDFVDLLNELNDENDILKQQLQTRYIVNKQYEELQRLKKENNELKKQVEDCRDYNAILYKNCIQKDRRWLKKIKRVEDELEEHIKENVRLRELIEDDS